MISNALWCAHEVPIVIKMKNILIILISFLSVVATLQAHSKYSGIYEGTYEEYTLDEGYDSGIFIAFVDSNNNVTLWEGNEDWGTKKKFKIDAQGYGTYKSDGYRIGVQFNQDDGFDVTIDGGATVTLTSVSKSAFTDTPGAAELLAEAVGNPTYYTDDPLELSLDGFDQSQLSSDLMDALTFLSGEWKIKAKASIHDDDGGFVSVAWTGDTIITPTSIYMYGKVLGESVFIRQDPYLFDYNDGKLTHMAYDFTKREISASGSVPIEYYDGTVTYTMTQRVSYYDTDDDGLSNYTELELGTNLLNADSDGDRMSDYAEIEAGTDPSDKTEYPANLKVQVSLAKGISGDGEATVLIDDVSYPVSLVRGKGTVQVALPTGSTYTVSASMDALTSGTATSVTLAKS
jgi:hypothetical protein